MSISGSNPVSNGGRNRNIIIAIIAVLAFCFCVVALGAVGGGVYLTRTWATATRQEQYARETATQAESYAQATATRQEAYARATATKQEEYARATATRLEKNAQATARAESIFGLVPEGIPEQFPTAFYYDPFDQEGAWDVGPVIGDQYWQGSRAVDERYIWTVEPLDGKFINWLFVPSVGVRMSFYFQMDVRLVRGSPPDSCYGFSFHHSHNVDYVHQTSQDDYYTLLICGQYYYVGMLKDGQWTPFRDWKENHTIETKGQNRMGVSGKNSAYAIYINGDQVFSFVDDTFRSGEFALVIEKFDQQPAEFEFDNIIVLSE